MKELFAIVVDQATWARSCLHWGGGFKKGWSGQEAELAVVAPPFPQLAREAAWRGSPAGRYLRKTSDPEGTAEKANKQGFVWLQIVGSEGKPGLW